MSRSCQSLVLFLLQLLLVIFISYFRYNNLTGWFGSSYVVVYFLIKKGTVDLNKTWSVEQSAPLMVLVSSRCHFGLPASPLQNLKGANVYSGVAKRSSI